MAISPTIILITQWSAFLTVVTGILALIVTLIASFRLWPGVYRNTLISNTLFLILILIGTGAMSIFHFTALSFKAIAIVSEEVWYLFMFIGYIFAVYDSFYLLHLRSSVNEHAIAQLTARVKEKMKKKKSYADAASLLFFVIPLERLIILSKNIADSCIILS
jgi:hypothetical protein